MQTEIDGKLLEELLERIDRGQRECGHTPRPARLILAWRESRFEMTVSLRLLQEFQTVLSREKFRRYLTYEEALEHVMWLRESVTEDYLIALALSSEADLIVSGDGHLPGLEDESLPKVLRTAEFLTLLQTKI